MNEQNEYNGSKVKNHFTAYLLGFIRGRRRDYLKKKVKISNMEAELEEKKVEKISDSIEELLELEQKERLLLREAGGEYPEWNELSDQRLIQALLNLSEEERKLIYQHVFEEQSFEKMGITNQLSVVRVKSMYYYAIRKIRKWMGGN